MARGSESKDKITQLLLEIFPGSFKYDKEIRIPVKENGEIIQVKVTLTAAKTNVSNGEDSALPGDLVTGLTQAINGEASKVTTLSTELTEEEKENIKSILSSLGLY